MPIVLCTLNDFRGLVGRPQRPGGLSPRELACDRQDHISRDMQDRKRTRAFTKRVSARLNRVDHAVSHAAWNARLSCITICPRAVWSWLETDVGGNCQSSVGSGPSPKAPTDDDDGQNATYRRDFITDRSPRLESLCADKWPRSQCWNIMANSPGDHRSRKGPAAGGFQARSDERDDVVFLVFFSPAR